MLELKLLDDKEFLDIYYHKKPILQDELDIFLKALKDYRADLYENINENEDALIANALAPFFQKLGFKTRVKSKQVGKSEVDLALLRNDNNSPINAIGGGDYKNLEILIEAKKPDSKEFFNPFKKSLTKPQKELAKLKTITPLNAHLSLRGSSEATSKQSTTNTNAMDCHEGANAPSRNDMGRDFKAPFHTPLDSKNPNAPEDIPPTFSPHCKALYEAILYYFREREAGNSSLKFIIITDFYRFFIFRDIEFKRLFYDNKEFQKSYTNFTNKNSNTSEFYAECERILKSQNYENSIPKKDLFDNVALKGFYIELKTLFSKDFSDKDLKILKPIFKAFSPEFLLDTFNPNDANTLNKAFYNELLYILGLEEQKQNGKIIIAASEESKAGHFTLYNAILQKCKDKDIFKAKTKDERFESLMQLIILWLNRILFLKLIEASLVKFNNDKNLKFLNIHKVPRFSILSGLFFEILAKNSQARNSKDLEALYYLPYLNSSIFEKQELENTLLDIKDLENADFEYFKLTQIKDKNAKKKQGKIKLLDYIFEFLDSFDFGSGEEESELITQKELISSSVLGLVFEKLNGYKEGSFYTPSFITSYMCKQSLEKIVLDKFNQNFGLSATSLNDLRISLKKEDRNAQKALLKSIKICDPAVGSGHFLVSALNAFLKIYDELNLFDEDFYLTLQNDEIFIKDRQNKLIEYKKPSFEKDRAHLVQKELFEFKQSIIENCLFGVDINKNSYEITKLRLWIELLKHSYYESFDDETYHALKTLPNIDINIKCGNSLISHFEIQEYDKDKNPQKGTFAWLKQKDSTFSKNFKEKLSRYNQLVKNYKKKLGNKKKIEEEIDSLKADFKETLLRHSHIAESLEENLKKFVTTYGDECFDIETPFGMEMINIIRKKNAKQQAFKFQPSLNEPEPKPIDEKGQDLLALIHKDFESLESLKQSDTFEWRFAFPEVLDLENLEEEQRRISSNNAIKATQSKEKPQKIKDTLGDFIGFDLIIGNPPYIRQEEIKELKPHLSKAFSIYKGTSDIYTYFFELGFKLLRQNGILSFITSNKWCRAGYGEPLREFLLKNTTLLEYIDFNGLKVFDQATVDTSILSFSKSIKKDNAFKFLALNEEGFKEGKEDLNKIKDFKFLKQKDLSKESFSFADEALLNLKAKIESRGTPLKDWDINIYRGILTGYNEAFIIDSEKRAEILRACDDTRASLDSNGLNERERTEALIKPILRGRDIKRYSYEWAGLWVIGTFPALKLDIDKYPAIKKYLASFGKRLEQSGEKNIDGIKGNDARKKTSNKWFETQDNIAYYGEFAKPKIVWNPVSGEYFFAYLKETMYFNNSLFMITQKNDYNHLPPPSAEAFSKISPSLAEAFSKISPSLAEGDKGGGAYTHKHRYLAPYMKGFSRQMRSNPTDAERKLWQELRNKKLGYGFRRQFVIDSKYIADFVCLEKRLIIECDGGQHNGSFEDIQRDFYLKSQHFRILRFWNNEILQHLDGVINVIKEALNDDLTRLTHPLAPSAKGGGNETLTTETKATHLQNKESLLLYILGLMNSTLYKFLMTQMTNLIETGKYAYGAKEKIENLPIPKISPKQEAEFATLVREIIESRAKNQSDKVQKLEKELDLRVCELYGLSKDEHDLLSLVVSLLLIAAIESKILHLLQMLCENFENELKDAFRFCEGLKIPHYQYEPKIIYPNMAKEFIAYLDTQGFFTNQKCFILTDKCDKSRLLYLTAVLNSKINFWYFMQIGATLGAGGYEMSKIFVEKLPVIETHKIDSKILQEIESLASQILENKRQNTQDLEARLDELIYQSYNLNQNEIDLIESEFNNKERERERTEVIDKIYQLLERFLAYQNTATFEAKIIWAEMTQSPCFIYEDKGYYINQTCYFIPRDDVYLCAVLNSKLIYFYMKQIASNLGDGAFRWIKQFVEKLPIIQMNTKNKEKIINIQNVAKELIALKQSGENTEHLEYELDSLIYDLYALNENEIKLIESTFANGGGAISFYLKAFAKLFTRQSAFEEVIFDDYQGKIIYPCIMAKEPCFVYEEKGFFAPAPANLITGEEAKMKYLTGLLNSKFVYFSMRAFYMGGGIEGEFKTNNLLKLPIPKITAKNQSTADKITALVDAILESKATDSTTDTSGQESQIDNLVYKLYDLNHDEIQIIEGK